MEDVTNVPTINISGLLNKNLHTLSASYSFPTADVHYTLGPVMI